MSLLLPLIAGIVVVILLHPALQERCAWRAMVTPLASIIGSGFLIVAPLLGAIAGEYALWGMALVVLAAYGIGEVIRFNIRYAEPELARGERPLLLYTERAGNFALSVAYVISVTFYLRLMASFILDGIGMHDEFAAKILTTVVLLFIGLVGWRRGLRSLERLEQYSVSVKLAIIVALLLGLALYDAGHAWQLDAIHAEPVSNTERLRMLAGMLLVVQGFETSRYLGGEYGAALRVSSMRQAQWLSGLIYLVFVALFLPLLPGLGMQKPDETAIISLAGQAAWVLSPMLVVAAVMSQFSAAVADTVGAGGLIEEESRHRLSARGAYPLIVALAVALVWIADVFEIVTLASRAFAIYYFAQALVAWQVIPNGCHWRGACQLLFGVISLLLLAVVLFARPVG
ncbi:MAG: hypothetical protein OI74_15125 [Gammaproteobacteria bacterium (ex Lamellibrachia satsuma)]|nr:MAG: hypothetical protein HPY30_00065 [Gammaproteobacteria bacterium (ex Lamellibrachia satsuma)]RRS31220.1 MAG: hypothetical protein OI74_15125 [Gammaproteobacteria bacterium (ex Lamellibrachia satsuma)]RRS33327.1 MAG: hypothetical protein NV67_16495 [Gammaproteobacteria bacterium (ex Lamellibrachia satsuma)]